MKCYYLAARNSGELLEAILPQLLRCTITAVRYNKFKVFSHPARKRRPEAGTHEILVTIPLARRYTYREHLSANFRSHINVHRLARHSLRTPNVPEESRLFRRGDSHARPRNRNQHRHFQRRQCGAASPASLPRSRQALPSLRTLSYDWNHWTFL